MKKSEQIAKAINDYKTFENEVANLGLEIFELRGSKRKPEFTSMELNKADDGIDVHYEEWVCGEMDCDHVFIPLFYFDKLGIWKEYEKERIEAEREQNRKESEARKKISDEVSLKAKKALLKNLKEELGE